MRTWLRVLQSPKSPAGADAFARAAVEADPFEAASQRPPPVPRPAAAPATSTVDAISELLGTRSGATRHRLSSEKLSTSSVQLPRELHAASRQRNEDCRRQRQHQRASPASCICMCPGLYYMLSSCSSAFIPHGRTPVWLQIQAHMYRTHIKLLMWCSIARPLWLIRLWRAAVGAPRSAAAHCIEPRMPDARIRCSDHDAPHRSHPTPRHPQASSIRPHLHPDQEPDCTFK
jgi:hypothetical protein